MKRIAIVAVLLLFLVACAKEELPPSPPAPGGDSAAGRAMAGLAAGMPAWASSPKNVAVTPSQAYFNDGVVVSVSNFDFIYSHGYYFNSKTRTWEKFSLQGELVQDWLKGQGIGSVVVDQSKFEPGDNYFVVYACTKVGKEWDCNSKKWMLVTFKVVGAATGAIPELANVGNFVVTKNTLPFTVLGTTAEKDNFAEINVIRYDAKYSEPKGLVVLVHVFDFNNRAEVDKTINTMFRDIVINGWKIHKGHNLAVFLDENDHRDAVWTSGKKIIFVETFHADSANKEVIEMYLDKYPSDLKKLT